MVLLRYSMRYPIVILPVYVVLMIPVFVYRQTVFTDKHNNFAASAMETWAAGFWEKYFPSLICIKSKNSSLLINLVF
ncbi:MAG: hypothetical protein C0592_08075 [Marinilabiliales bacterium]|nr:MAG: hypothetical protein C0592_08075 [Marinilabiliales bacterium]